MTQFGTQTPHAGEPGFESWLHSQFQSSANVNPECRGDDSSGWVPAKHTGQLGGVSSSLAESALVLATAGILGVSQQIEAFFLSF